MFVHTSRVSAKVATPNGVCSCEFAALYDHGSSPIWCSVSQARQVRLQPPVPVSQPPPQQTSKPSPPRPSEIRQLQTKAENGRRQCAGHTGQSPSGGQRRHSERRAGVEVVAQSGGAGRLRCREHPRGHVPHGRGRSAAKKRRFAGSASP